MGAECLHFIEYEMSFLFYDLLLSSPMEGGVGALRASTHLFRRSSRKIRLLLLRRQHQPNLSQIRHHISQH